MVMVLPALIRSSVLLLLGALPIDAHPLDASTIATTDDRTCVLSMGNVTLSPASASDRRSRFGTSQHLCAAWRAAIASSSYPAAPRTRGPTQPPWRSVSRPAPGGPHVPGSHSCTGVTSPSPGSTTRH